MQTNQKSYFAKDFSSKEQLTTFHGSSTKFPADDFPGTGKENKEWFLLVHLQTRINSVHKTLRFDIYLCSPLKAAPHTHSNGVAASIISTCSTDSPGLVPPPSSLLVQTYKTTAPAQPLSSTMYFQGHVFIFLGVAGSGALKCHRYVSTTRKTSYILAGFRAMTLHKIRSVQHKKGSHPLLPEVLFPLFIVVLITQWKRRPPHFNFTIAQLFQISDGSGTRYQKITTTCSPESLLPKRLLEITPKTVGRTFHTIQSNCSVISIFTPSFNQCAI